MSEENQRRTCVVKARQKGMGEQSTETEEQETREYTEKAKSAVWVNQSPPSPLQAQRLQGDYGQGMKGLY